MNLRLWGTDEECLKAIEAIQVVLVVVSVSGPKHDRGTSSLVRYYVETRGVR